MLVLGGTKNSASVFPGNGFRHIGPLRQDARVGILEYWQFIKQRLPGKGSKKFAKSLDTLVAGLLNEETPAWNFRYNTGSRIFEGYELVVLPDAHGACGAMISLINNLLHERGYRPDILAHSEHVLIGSSEPVPITLPSEITEPGQVKKVLELNGKAAMAGKIFKNPDTPVGILRGDITLQEANVARELVVFEYCVMRSPCPGARRAFLLGPLDGGGRLIREPQQIFVSKFFRLLGTVPFDEAIHQSIVPEPRHDGRTVAPEPAQSKAELALSGGFECD